MLFESQHNYPVFFVISDQCDQLLHTRIWCETNCQLSSKATLMGHLVYTVQSSLLFEHMGRYCSHHEEPKVWISKIHQIPLQQDPTESLSPLLEKAEHDIIARAFKYTWDQNNYSEAFREGKVITGGITVAGQSEAPRSQSQPYRDRGGKV